MKPAELTALAPADESVFETGPGVVVGVDTDSAAVDPAPPAEARAIAIPRHTPRWWNRLWYRFEEWASRLSVRNHFWHRVCSWIWLPLAFRSGIKIHTGDIGTFAAVLPFRKFNRNWYNAMAGGALLGNAEIAGGMYVFRQCGADYTVVCKHLSYEFMRPCVGPAVYRIEPRDDVEQMLQTGDEFNLTIDMDIVQMVQAKMKRERRVGKCVAEFHVAPKALYRARKNWRKRHDHR